MADIASEPGDEDIYAGRVVAAIKALRDAYGYSIHQGIDAVSERYQLLRREHPERFTVGPQEWGQNFYS
ncbi:hypothetical protein [Nocardia stercoris]|uniref:Uncharacterized protein n=1 Tax=Nocardia stercoris TaxID=2483361 RepID=A0A3M2L2E0_9NOCA|nr:hypothetical protein [Nocardia stercoris]RMI31711.1 hypothetical protein EBN03_16015 [Nocardia stercoris]